MIKGFLRNFRLNSKGVTLLEAVIAILLISMISVGVTSLFFSLSRLAKTSDTQLKLNTVMRVVKENVSKSVRDNVAIYGTDGAAYPSGVKAQDAQSEADKTFKNLPIKDLSNQTYIYVFDLTYDSVANSVQKYWITIRNQPDGEILTRVSIEVYIG